MIMWLQNKLQKSNKLFALLLLLFCSQLSVSAHTHAEIDTNLEACSVCLVGQNAEFDDTVFSNTSTSVCLKAASEDYRSVILAQAFDNTPLSLYLRGPPA